MKNITKLLASFIFFIIISISIKSVNAQDSIVVQTFTFDYITLRNATFEFPDNDDTYRKIWMYYTLKCDDNTQRDRFRCGEWDYLTYNRVYHKTGEKDSNLITHPLYKIGNSQPDTIKITNDTTYTTYSKNLITSIIDNTFSEEEYILNEGGDQLELTGKNIRIQIVISKDDLKNIGMKSGDINRLKLNFLNGGYELEDFTIRMKSGGSTDDVKFDNSELPVVYKNNLKVDEAGEVTFNFIEPVNWANFLNLIVDISFHNTDPSATVLLSAVDSGNLLSSAKSDSYLDFDGTNDYVDCGSFDEIEDTDSFTMESWININNWQNNNKIMGVGSDIAIRCGGNGEIRSFIRNPENTYGFAKGAVDPNEWTHIAMVYNGAAENSEDRLKLYINGNQEKMLFSAPIPDNTPMSDLPFTITGLDNDNWSLKGGIDNVRIWSSALDEETIKNWMDKAPDNDHPVFENLLAYYDFNENSGTVLTDQSGNGRDGILVGTPQWNEISPTKITGDKKIKKITPEMTFYSGEYESHLDTSKVETKIANPPVSIEEFEAGDHMAVRKNISYAWKSGYEFTYGPDGNKIDSNFVEPAETIVNDSIQYWSEPTDVKETYETGRFITPYGINLDLGPDGFTWRYDVTDYAPLLKGKVEMSAGNQQELLDVKFVFIKGTPPRTVKKIDRIWGPKNSYKYKNLDSDQDLSAKTLPLHHEASQFKVKTRLTGHGHHSDDGNFPHCCEWKDNDHFLYVNDQQVAKWKIFLYTECALNPVYPQGGTWPGAREGWCPGDVVRDYDFEITDHVKGNSVTLDYGITPVPSDNQGMGNGSYHIAMQLFHYSEPNFDMDVEVYDIKAPNNWEYYSRKNPICSNPKVIVRNNGKDTITTLKFKYGVSGNDMETYHWTGDIGPGQKAKIKPMESISIDLPIPGSEFWVGDERHIFTVEVSDPNNTQDIYADNNILSREFDMPDLYEQKITIHLQTNRRAGDFSLVVKDITGNEVISRTNLSNQTLYKEKLELTDGCYTMEVVDVNNLGLSYWAYPDQGNGYLRITDANDKLLKEFDPDFGRGMFYSFNLGDITHVQEKNTEYLVDVHPNPATDLLNIRVDYKIGDAALQLFDLNGRMMLEENIFISNLYEREIDLTNYAPGAYYLRIVSDEFDIKKSFIKKQ